MFAFKRSGLPIPDSVHVYFMFKCEQEDILIHAFHIYFIYCVPGFSYYFFYYPLEKGLEENTFPNSINLALSSTPSSTSKDIGPAAHSRREV